MLNADENSDDHLEASETSEKDDFLSFSEEEDEETEKSSVQLTSSSTVEDSLSSELSEVQIFINC